MSGRGIFNNEIQSVVVVVVLVVSVALAPRRVLVRDN